MNGKRLKYLFAVKIHASKIEMTTADLDGLLLLGYGGAFLLGAVLEGKSRGFAGHPGLESSAGRRQGVRVSWLASPAGGAGTKRAGAAPLAGLARAAEAPFFALACRRFQSGAARFSP